MSIEHNPIENSSNLESVSQIPRELENLLERSDMRIGSYPWVINNEGNFCLSEGTRLPVTIIEIDKNTAKEFASAAEKLAKIEITLKLGFETLFRKDPDTAANLLRYSFNVLPNKNEYVEKLIEYLLKNPKRCLDTAHSYRGDGRYGKRGEVVFNEVNAFPGGTHWVTEIARLLRSKGFNTLGAWQLEDIIVENLARDFQQAGEDKKGIIYFPTESLPSYKVTTEMLAIGSRLKESYGISSLVGEIDALRTDPSGVYVEFNGEKNYVRVLDGVSSPTSFQKNIPIIDAAVEGKITCPAIAATTVSISNKGMFALLTSIREGKIPPLPGMSQDELTVLTEPIPNTYWLNDQHRINPISIEQLLSEEEYVLKPYNDAGGNGVILKPTEETLKRCVRDSSYLAQAYLRPVRTIIKDGNNNIDHEGSLDPYFAINTLGESTCGFQILGFISRGSVPGALSNVSAHTGNKSGYLKNHLGIIVISSQ